MFSEIIVNQTLRDKSFQYKELHYFDKVNFGPKYATIILKEAAKLRDIGLVEKRHYGNAHYGHRCNEVPFFHKSRKQIENKKPNELSKILDREKLHAFQNKLNETEKLYYNTALNRQVV